MVSRKYTSDYRLEDTLDPKTGRMATRSVYQGQWFRFCAGAAAVKRTAWIYTLLTALCALGFVLPLLFAWFMGNLGLIENLRRPNFDWTDESRPIKQDMPVMLTMLIGVLAAGAPTALYFALLYRYLAPLPYVSICTLLVLAATVATYRWLKTRGAAIFDAL